MCLQLQNFARAMRYKTVDQSQKERHIQCMCASGQDAMNHILKTIRLRMRCAQAETLHTGFFMWRRKFVIVGRWWNTSSVFCQSDSG